MKTKVKNKAIETMKIGEIPVIGMLYYRYYLRNIDWSNEFYNIFV